MAAGLLDDPLSITRIARLESLADPGPATSSDSLPITRFGAYAECDEDKWPYGMCTLKVITHTDSPPVLIAAAAASQGWVSGVIPDSPSDRACQPNISAASCKTCLESKNATLCITCIQNSKRLNAAASCATCANLTWFQEECATCVRNKGSACTDPGWTCSTACEPDGVTCSTECADDSCNPQQVNLGGELMVLAYGSDQNITGLATAPAGTPQRCCAACRNADGCNGWVFCNDPQGCGRGCADHTRRVAAMNLSAAEADDQAPIMQFGQNAACNGDKWPYGMCSLKILADTANPPVFRSGQEGSGCMCLTLPAPATAHFGTEMLLLCGKLQ
eukprot:jgi/Chrzof1/12411/Cz06g33150.t1